MQESQFSQHIQQSHNPTTTINMVKSLPLEESQLCDDILSCILALDEVIAEFDDSSSLSSPSPSETPASLTTNSVSSVPIESRQRNNNSNSLQSVKLKSQPQHESPPPISLILPLSSPSHQLELQGKDNGEIKITPIRTLLSSQVHSEVKQDITTNSKNNTVGIGMTSLTLSGEESQNEMDMDQHGLKIRLDLRQDLIKKSTSPSGKNSKIPSLKTSSSTQFISSTGAIGGTGGGGSFPKVKMRSCPNPLLEYRSVKMQNFVLPDELPAELMKENWCFSSGKNLPRSLARTRETCITDGDGQIPKSKNPRFIEGKTDGVKISSKIPRFNKTENNSSSIPIPKPRKNGEKSPSKSPVTNPIQVVAIESSPKKMRQEPQLSPSKTIPTQFYFSPQPHHGGHKRGRKIKKKMEFGSPDGQKVFRHNGNHLIPETDDGYLSMINRSEECPALWPEEMIENEIFSPAELKRLSFTEGAEKTDYFSDDSLESESPGLVESLSSASASNINGKGTYNKPTKVRLNAKDYFGSPPSPSQSSISDTQENRTPISFFVPMETKSVNHNVIKKRKNKQKKLNNNIDPSDCAKLEETHKSPQISVHSKSLTEEQPQFIEVCQVPQIEEEVKNKVSILVNQDNSIPKEIEKESKIISLVCNTEKEKTNEKEPEKATSILSRIEEFAEKLAAKIERSGSEEAAATLTLNQVEIELENFKSWTPQTNEQVVVMSNTENNVPVPPLTDNETEKMAEKLISPPVQQEEQVKIDSNSEQINSNINSINIFIPGEQVVVVSNNDQVEKIESSKNIEILPVHNSSSEDQFFDWDETEHENTKTEEIVKALGISLEYSTPDGKRDSTLTDDDDNVDNTSDDLSETPPEFIPPPPIIDPQIPPNSTDILLNKITVWNTIATASPVSQNATNSLNLSKRKDANGTVKSFTHSPSNDADTWKSLERNSRSSEDLIHALNSHDERPSTSINRLGASTLPLNTRPPSSGGALRPLRNMFNRFRKSKNKRSSMSLSEHSTTLSPIADMERSNSPGIPGLYLSNQLNESESNPMNESTHFTNGERKINEASGQTAAKKPSFFMRMFSRKQK